MSRHETPLVAGSEGEGREGVEGKGSRRIRVSIGMFYFTSLFSLLNVYFQLRVRNGKP
jgi:hypothetical protein